MNLDWMPKNPFGMPSQLGNTFEWGCRAGIREILKWLNSECKNPMHRIPILSEYNKVIFKKDCDGCLSELHQSLEEKL